jgi:hypothetical protein
MVVVVLMVMMGESMVDAEMAAMLQKIRGKKKILVRDYSSDTIKRIQTVMVDLTIKTHTFLCTYFVSLYNRRA